MSTTPALSHAQNAVRRWLSLAFILVIVASMGLSGWFALYEGSTRFLLPFTADDATAQVTLAVTDTRAHPALDTIRRVSEETWALSLVTSPQRFADSRIMEQGIYYTTMPRTNQVLMAVHVLFGSFCMLVGGLQFWPGFRKRFMKAHRIIGTIYVVTVPVSVVTVLVYMARTPPHHIYAHLVAWIALWVFGTLALVAVAMAVRALKARRIFEHQAWMALSFGCLMVAPLLRLDWVLLAQFLPHIDQETLNLVTMGIMLPQTMLISYGLILVNRQNPRPLRQRVPATLARTSATTFLRLMPGLFGMAVLFAGLNVWLYEVRGGISGLAAAAKLLPVALLQREQSVLASHPLSTLLFTFGISLAFPLGLVAVKRLLRTSGTLAAESATAGHEASAPATDTAIIATALLSLVSGIGASILGWGIGLAPNAEWVSGGTPYVVNGLVIAGFSLRLLAARAAKQPAQMKESLVFLLCLLPFPTLFFITLEAMSLLPVPVDYIAAGQGYVVPAGFSGALLFLAILYVVHGQATREHN